MRRSAGIVLFFSFCGLRALAQPDDLSVATIPASLRENADVVKRFESMTLDVDGISEATVNVHVIKTVMNDKARDELIFRQFTTKYIVLKNVEIRVYDSTGKQKDKFKKKDLQFSDVGEGLIEDGHLCYMYVHASTYPMTIDFEYEIKLTGTVNLPTYEINGANESVEQ